MDSGYGGTTKLSLAQEDAWSKVENEFGSMPYNCINLDSEIKRISDKIIAERKKNPLPDVDAKVYLNALEVKKNSWEVLWASKSCRDVIENIRLESMAVALTNSSIAQEKSVLGVSNKNENLYIFIGGIVLLAGLYIVLK